MSLGNQARTFREVFNQKILSNLSAYGQIDQDLWNMQIELIREESAEFLEAADECFADPENLDRRTDLAKELSDLVFVAYQFAAAFNIDLDGAMALVFNSNMSKLDEHGMPIYREDGKVLKGPNYESPDLSSCVPSPMLTFDYDTNGK
jgi:predicted HAD superfamily Cof-like phosphohydrolase